MGIFNLVWKNFVTMLFSTQRLNTASGNGFVWKENWGMKTLAHHLISVVLAAQKVMMCKGTWTKMVLCCLLYLSHLWFAQDLLTILSMSGNLFPALYGSRWVLLGLVSGWAGMVWLWVHMPSHHGHQPGQAAAWTSQSGPCCRRLDTAEKVENVFTDFSDYRLSMAPSAHQSLWTLTDQNLS